MGAGPVLVLDTSGFVVNEGWWISRAPVQWNGVWEIVEEPATDEQLITEMERLAVHHLKGTFSDVYRHCARMLRDRKVKP